MAFTKARGNLPVALDSNTAFSYGKILAELHSAFDVVTIHTKRPSMEVNHLIDQSISTLREFHGHLIQGMEYLESKFNDIKLTLSKASCESGLIHGDFISANSTNAEPVPD